MDTLFGVSPTDLGAAGLVVLVVLLILTGRLVPRSTLLDMREERDTWRSAHGKSEAARQAEREMTTELLELSRTAGHVLTSLPRSTEGVADARLAEAHDRQE
ncbi:MULTISPECIES: hypothetical protein [unclassified Streptomyces]|uniref:hypothetical protein n=1 Tax=unclassified Streptomyces TaxID=2593676 RepID=UPI00226FFC7C|nr:MULTISPECIES: hypothetical protein [unclassified Streptomyces]MCY0919595.1 hypothetical protein [Streptomyces sp. H27-G5]MCY0959653.1 hypothetical protein [Streptomyces sp. H27-H5]